MKVISLSRTSFRIVFALSLLISHNVFASQQISVLNATDSRVVGQAVFEEASDFVAKLEMTLQGQVYTGTGIIRNNVELSTLSKQRQGIRSDRAFLSSFSKQHNKHAKIMLVSNNGLTLACELIIYGSELAGHCINPENQQSFNLKISSGAP